VTQHPEQKGFTVWYTGLSGAGKSTLAEMLYHELRKRSMKVEMLDGDVVRTNLSKGLGFSKEDRDTNILRIGFVANLLTRNEVAVIVSAISPYRDTRGQVRAMIQDFVEIFVHATVEECAKRDVKGLYAKALAGEITGFTGVDDPYEPPQSPEIYVDTMNQSPVESLQLILDRLGEMGYIDETARLAAF
jgi:adenylylsulfate kinase